MRSESSSSSAKPSASHLRIFFTGLLLPALHFCEVISSPETRDADERFAAAAAFLARRDCFPCGGCSFPPTSRLAAGDNDRRSSSLDGNREVSVREGERSGCAGTRRMS